MAFFLSIARGTFASLMLDRHSLAYEITNRSNPNPHGLAIGEVLRYLLHSEQHNSQHVHARMSRDKSRLSPAVNWTHLSVIGTERVLVLFPRKKILWDAVSIPRTAVAIRI